MKSFISKILTGYSVRFDQLIPYLLKEYELEFFVVFGSFANGKTWAGSDLDIGFVSKNRMWQAELEKFVTDIAAFLNLEKVDAIDLYFDDAEELAKKAFDQYKKPLSLLQYRIYSTGELLYEREDALFLQYKNRALMSLEFAGKDIKKLIIDDKLNFMAKIIDKVDLIERYDSKISVKIREATSENAVDVQKETLALLECFSSATVFNILKVVDSMVRLNNFILTEFYKKRISTRLDSFMKLAELDKLTADEKIHVKNLSKVAMLNNFLTIDYFYTPWWSINETIKLLLEGYPDYVKIVRKVTE